MIGKMADTLASLLDMLEVDPVARAEGLNCQIPANFCDLDRADKLDFMIDVIAPWYASYCATWKSFVDEVPGAVCVLRYEESRRDPAEALRTAVSHAGFITTLFRCRQSPKRGVARKGEPSLQQGRQRPRQGLFLAGAFGAAREANVLLSPACRLDSGTAGRCGDDGGPKLRRLTILREQRRSLARQVAFDELMLH